MQRPFQILIALGGWLALLGNPAMAPAQTTFNFASDRINNRLYRLSGDGLDSTFAVSNSVTFTLSNETVYELEVNPGASPVATVQLTTDASGDITTVKWQDGDGSMAPEDFVTLDASWYNIAGSTFELLGSEIQLDFSTTDLPAAYFEEIWQGAQGSSPWTIKLFPGDYELQVGDADDGNGVASLAVEVNMDGEWNNTVQWKPFSPFGSLYTSYSTLSGSYHSINSAGDTLTLTGTDVYIDEDLDNASFILPDYETTLTGDQSMNLFPGNLDIKFGSGDGLAAVTASLFDPATGALHDTTYWADMDSSQADGTTVLDSSYVVYGNDTLTLKGIAAVIDFLASDNQIHVPGLAAVDAGYTNYKLFPGDYQVQVSATATRLCLEAEASSGGLADGVIYFDFYDSSIPMGPLYCEFFTQNGDSLQLHSRTFTYDMAWVEEDTLELNQISSAQRQLTPGISQTRNLLPSGYYSDFTLQDSSAADFRTFLRIANGTGRFSGPIYYTDLGAGGNPFLPDTTYPGGYYYLRGTAVTYMGLPDADDNYFPSANPYATLGDHLDGSYYRAANGSLYVKYEERYTDITNLDLRILDASDQEISLASVGRNYGPNWLQLSLPSGSFTSGEFYVLEVTDPKGRLSMLKFYYP